MASLLSPYGEPVRQEQWYKIIKYIELLEKWNRKVSLTSVSAFDQMVRVHFGESLSGLAFIGPEEGRLADVGSGAGFPGLVIALFRPRLQVSLLESNKKKCAFLNEVIRLLELSNAGVLASRYERSPLKASSLDYVTSRAMGGLENLLGWSSGVLNNLGTVILWTTRDVAAHFKGNGRWRWKTPVEIPGSKRRVVVAATKG